VRNKQLIKMMSQRFYQISRVQTELQLQL